MDETRPTRRRFLGRLGALGVLGGLAGCDGSSSPVSIQFVGVQDTVLAVVVTAGIANEANEELRVLVRAEITVGTGENTETHQRSTQATLPPMRNSRVKIRITEGKLVAGTKDEPIDAEVWVGFLESDRSSLTPRPCDSCPSKG